MKIFTDPIFILHTIGLIGLFVVIFIESGLLIGFFLPGDSVLFTAGLLASQGFYSLPVLIVGCAISAILGDSVGYYIGKKTGVKIFVRDNSLFFHKDNVEKARLFYEKHGKKTIAFARFVPVIRTFAPVLAGIGNMNYKTFISYNIFGGIAWCVSLPVLGYFLGTQVPNIDKYIIPTIAIIILLSFSPLVFSKFKK